MGAVALTIAGLTLIAAAASLSAAPATSTPQDPGGGVPTARAAPAPGGVAMDGSMSDPAWREAPPVTDFVQVDPDEGAPATEATEVRILYDREALYVGARLHDREGPRTRMGRRDAVLQDSDWFAVSLDTDRDGMTAYRFRVNPSGVRGDEIVSRDGGSDASWEPVWEAFTSVDESGWTVEMRIPFSQLRLSGDEAGPWGIQLERILRRNDETAVFSFTPRREAGGIPRYGVLTGIEEVAPEGRLEVLPYVLARTERGSPGAAEPEAGAGGDVGVDLRYRLTPAFTLDAAVNPDFGQVEADPARVNLTAFERRFPENRRFFVEGADIFRFGEGGFVTPDLFYSRRIGAAPQGHLPAGAVRQERLEAVPILGAGKVTGRTRDGWSVGILGARTEGEEARYVGPDGEVETALLEPRTTYLAGRVRRELREGATTAGAMATAVRRADTSVPELRHLNDAGYAAGMDFRHEWADRRWRISGDLRASRVEGRPEAMTTLQQASARYFQRPDASHLGVDETRTSLAGWAGSVAVRRQAGRRWRGGLEVGAVSPGHEVNDLGFQTMADRVTSLKELEYRRDEPGDRFHRWRLAATGRTDANFGGDLVMAAGLLRFDGLFHNRWGLRVQAVRQFPTLDDRLTRGGPLARTAGSMSVYSRLHTDRRRSVAASGVVNVRRDDDGGRSAMLRTTLALRPAAHWSVTLSPRLVRTATPAQYLGRVEDPMAEATFGARYLFGELARRTLEIGAGLDVALRPGLTVELHGQAYTSAGRFRRPGELRRPGTRHIARYGEDVGRVEETDEGFRIEPGAEGRTFVLPDRDFTFRSFRGSAVLRWEWHRGSTLYLVWQQDRSANLDAADFRLGRGIGDLTGLPGRHMFQLKVNYWLNP